MTDADATLRAELEQLVVEYAWRVDHRDLPGLADLCLADVEIQGLTDDALRGVDALVAWGRAQPEGAVTRHVVTNLRCRRQAPEAARGWVTSLFFLGPTTAGTVTPLYVGEYEDDYVLVDGRWRFARRRLHRVIGPGGPPR